MAAQIAQIPKNPQTCTHLRRLAIVVLLSLHALLLGYGASIHSPTIDEVAHLPAGISHWRFARFELYQVNPPLVRMVAALPVLAADAETPWHSYRDQPGRRTEFIIGNDLIRENGLRSFDLFTWARLACLPFSLVGAWVVYRWSDELFGSSAALGALAIWCLSPTILAHGQLITPDVAATSLGVLCCWRLWHWTERPTWRNTLWFGLALGLTELTKFTWVILVPLVVVLWAIKRLGHRKLANTQESAEPNERPGVWPCSFRFVIAMLLAHQIILLGYAYDRVLEPLKSFEFVSNVLKPDPKIRTGNIFAENWLGEIPVPLPACYVEGIDVQKLEFEREDRMSYLAGEFRYPGWWYYYLYALAIKVPLGFWLIGVLAVVALLLKRGLRVPWRDHVFLLLPAVVILVLVSANTGINRHMRYVLPAFPFVIIWISQIFAAPPKSKLFLAAGAGLLWAAASSLWIYPHSLSYFNELVGGPRHGHEHIINSNIDWGQDLLLLREWVQQHPEAADMDIAYFGGIYAAAAGLEGAAPPPGPETVNLQSEMPRGPQPGWYAVSVNYFYRLYPLNYRTANQNRLVGVQCDYRYFLELEPVETIGYSIYIYHISEEEAAALRERIWADAESG